VSQGSHSKSNTRNKNLYVDSQAGWSLLLFTLTLSCVLGLSFRLYFSPDRVKGWVDTAISKQAHSVDLRFDTAQLRLSRGAMPELAIVLKNVEVAPSPDCHPEPSLKIAELYVPFRVMGFFLGKIQVGTVAAEDMKVDVDGLKERCSAAALPPLPAQAAASGNDAAPPADDKKSASDNVRRVWWTEKQIRSIQSLVAGFDFKRVELQFEKQSKRIFFESFEVSSVEGEDLVRISSEVRVPPELTFGETVPSLKIEGQASSEKADLKIEAALSEGHLRAKAALLPAPENQIHIDTQVAVDDLPLSTLVPLLNKAGLLQQSMRPKFLWFDCEASISGQFQGLFKKNPLYLKNCNIEGDGTLVKVAAATRKPDGKWDPFRVDVAKVDLRRLLETLNIPGPDGVSENFGRLSGELKIDAADQAKFTGAIDGLQLRFSSRKVRALQLVNRIATEIEVKGDRKL
jgi:hypothetical protein